MYEAAPVALLHVKTTWRRSNNSLDSTDTCITATSFGSNELPKLIPSSSIISQSVHGHFRSDASELNEGVWGKSFFCFAQVAFPKTLTASVGKTLSDGGGWSRFRGMAGVARFASDTS